MKKYIAYIILPIILCLATAGACKSLEERPPSPLEAKYYDITTNLVARLMTNVVTITQTNVVTVTNSITGQVSSSEVLKPVQVGFTITNMVPVYNMTPNENAKEVSSVAGAIASPWGLGGITGSLVLGLFSLWGKLRGANRVSGGLAQIIETGKEVMTPEQRDKYVRWMIGHQQELGILSQATRLVQDQVDNEDARRSAEEIQKLLADATPTK